MRVRIYRLFDFFILSLGVFVVLVVPDGYDYLPITGMLIVFLSAYLIFKTRRNHVLFYLMTIIGLINISIGISDLIKKGVDVSAWQLEGLRLLDYNGITAKTIIIFLVVMNLFLNNDVCKINLSKDNIQLLRMRSKLIANIGTVSLYAILFFGIVKEVAARNTGNYVSVSSSIYEYGVIIMCVVWYYSRDYKIIDRCIFAFVVLYSAFFLIIGDRSSVFMYVLLTYLLYYEHKFSRRNIFLGALIAVVGANIIDSYRNTSALDLSEIIIKAFSRGLYVDTVSWSYYGGIALIASTFIVSNRREMVLGYLLHFIGINMKITNPTSYVAENYGLLFNRGGGLCSPYFYMIGNYLGVVVGASIIGFLINRMFTFSKPQHLIYCYLITTMSLRWYLYNPTVLFRAILINLTIVLFVCKIFDSCVRRRINSKI